MAYGMGLLRKAGQSIRNFDDAYSSKINDMYTGMSENNPLKVAGTYVGGGLPSTRKLEYEFSGKEGPGEKALLNAVAYGLPAVNAVPKYVLPATGVTLAGKALIDIASGLGQQTESTLIV